MFEDLLPLLAAAHHPSDEQVEGASEDELQALAGRIGIGLPAELREWLSVCRGSVGGEGGLFGIGNDRDWLNIDYMLSLFPSWADHGWIPIAGDGCGNYYVLLTGEPAGAVGFVDTMCAEDALDYLAASSLRIFLREFLIDVAEPSGWPFDMAYVSRVDPGLLNLAPSPFDSP